MDGSGELGGLETMETLTELGDELTLGDIDEMLQFVSNQVGEFPDLFSEPLCGSFPGGGSGNGNGNGSGSGGGGGSGAGSGDPSGQRPFSQVPLPAFSPSATSSQAATLPVKAPAASGPTPPRAAPVLQPRPLPRCRRRPS